MRPSHTVQSLRLPKPVLRLWRRDSACGMTPETLKHSGRKLVPQLAQGLLRADSVRPLNTMNSGA